MGCNCPYKKQLKKEKKKFKKLSLNLIFFEEFTCTTCNLNFAKKHYLAKHNAKHHGIKRKKPGRPKLEDEEIDSRKTYICSTCKQRFPKKSDLHDHALSEHDGYKCSFCEKLFDAPTKLNKVIKSRSD